MTPDTPKPAANKKYRLLPFRYERIDGLVLLVNDVGEYHFLTEQQFDDFTHFKLDVEDDTFMDLKSKFLATDTEWHNIEAIVNTKHRTKKAFQNDGISLHMVVPTIRCNCQCLYCQVSSRPGNKASRQTDMSLSTAKRVVDVIHESPCPVLKIEFQGGEPLLDLDTVKFIINYSSLKSAQSKKKVEYVVCTNLTAISERTLRYFKRHNVAISSSLDGPRDIHDMHRPTLNGQSSYNLFCAGREKARAVLGEGNVAALATITDDSLPRLKGIVDEYVSQGFHSIFIRPINPFGRAKTGNIATYTPEEFTTGYIEALNHIIRLNLSGYYLVEEYSRILAARILTPFGDAFVDLQSPTGAGLMCALYNYDGNVYASDEGRMLAEMGDNTFLLGNVHNHDFRGLFDGELARNFAAKTLLEAQQDCRDCVFQPYCGTDVVRDYVESGKLFERKAKSASCRLIKPVFERLFRILLDDDERTDVLWSWVTDRPLSTIRL